MFCFFITFFRMSFYQVINFILVHIHLYNPCLRLYSNLWNYWIEKSLYRIEYILYLPVSIYTILKDAYKPGHIGFMAAYFYTTFFRFFDSLYATFGKVIYMNTSELLTFNTTFYLNQLRFELVENNAYRCMHVLYSIRHKKSS